MTLKKPLLSEILLGLGLYSLANGKALSCAVSLFFYSLSAAHMSQTGDRGTAG